MKFRIALLLSLTFSLYAQTAQSPAKHIKQPATPIAALDPGSIANNIYRNKTLALTVKIPEAWVLRTDDLNAREQEEDKKETSAQQSASSAGARVLLAAFSRPPEARGEEINSSILIAAESQSNYPGLKDAAQYFYPLEEVAKAQGFLLDEDPYAIAIGPQTLVRADFHKDVGTRVMRQSTLAMLSQGYAISITVIAGTEDELEDLIDALSFTATK
jgi:hypothetical protein